MAETTAIPVQGSTMDIYMDGPARGTPGPAIVLLYHREGVDDFTKLVVRTLAAKGYRVAVPDVSHRVARDIPMKDRKAFLKDDEVVADIGATVQWLRARPDVDEKHIVIMGHCMGGRMALLGAGRLPGFCATVVYYGGSVGKPWGDEKQTPFDTLQNIKGPVIGFFGNNDTHPSPEDVNRIDAALTEHGITHTFHRYDDVGHGFISPRHDTPTERAAAADAWAKTFAFLSGIAPA
jgi:carboxymethylenebutenolidase